MIDLAQHFFEISSFCGHEALGNRHKVFIFNTEDTYQCAQQHYFDLLPDKVIYVFILLGDSQVAKISFYHNRQKIRRCGSGTLAAMAALRSARPNHNLLCFVSEFEKIQLLPSTEENHFYYSTTSLALNACVKTEYAAILKYSKIHVTSWLESEDELGYLVAVLSNELAVKTAEPDLNILSILTQRALIITAVADDKNGFVLRYFAPQYGNNEDAATGSANAILASYWFLTLNRNSLTSKQLSQTGGLFNLSTNQPIKNNCFKEELDKSREREPSANLHIPSMQVQVGGQCLIHNQTK